MPISNAKNILLTQNPGGLPNMQDAMLGYFQPMSFSVLTKTVVNFQVVETSTPVNTQGVRQPFTAQQLMMKPEGQRSWRWETLHCFPDVVLTTDDVVVFKGVRYRVMQKSDFTEYGYLLYQICQDYT